MRIDLFLSSTNLVKRRQVATDMVKNRVVEINSIVVKPSKEVKAGDIIKISMLKYTNTYKVLDIPKSKNTPKSDQNLFLDLVE